MPTDGPIATLPFPETVRTFPSSQGVTVVTYDWGGDGPPLILAHATGLHAHVWLPLVQRLRTRFHCYGVDLRAQGATSAPDDGNFSWKGVTDDFVAALDGLGLSGRGDVRGIGHSQGGFAVLSGALARPGTFAAIFGMEPVVFRPLPGHEPFAPAQNFMADMTRKRRRTFPSRQAAFDNFKAKMPFQHSDDDVIAAYVQWGFEDLADGTIGLVCPPEHEAALFEHSHGNLMDHLHELTARVTIALSEHANEGFAASCPEQAERIPGARLLHLPGRTHFGILEGTDEMAAVVADALA